MMSASSSPLAPSDAVVIRRACDADMPLVRDLAALDSSAELTGSVLVAMVDGQPRAALSLDDGRAVADPFAPSAAAVELLRMRADQLRDVDRKHQRVAVTRWIADRARA